MRLLDKDRTLDQAQEAKLELICKKLALKPGMKVLDIGCGWGGFGKYAAEKYHVNVYGITVSREQVTFARKFCKGLPVEIELQDYRKLKEEFDRIVSIGMFEHVGSRNYRTYMNVVHRSLSSDGSVFATYDFGNSSAIQQTPGLINIFFPIPCCLRQNRSLQPLKGNS